MTNIRYKAINKSNKVIFGMISSDQLDQLESLLFDRGLRLISYRHQRQKTYKTLSYDLQQTLWMSLRYYMMSGFNLPEAVEHMAQSSLDRKMQSVLFNVSDRLKQGEQFSTVMKSYLVTNDMVSLSLLETAEHTGDYQEILLDLEDHAKWQLEFKSRIQRSLRYPSIVFGALWLSIFCILYFFAPQLSSFFQTTHYTLPSLTSFLISLSQFVVNWPSVWILTPIIMIGCLKGLCRIFPNMQQLLLYIPGIKGAVLGYYYTNMAQIAYLHLKHGHSLLYSLKRLQKAFELDWMGQVLQQVIPEIEQGVSLTASLKAHPIVFSKFFLQLISVGETTNTLQENFKVISAYYERDTKKRITGYIKLIEPLMLIVMGALLVVIVGGLFYPMYSQMGLISQGGL